MIELSICFLLLVFFKLSRRLSKRLSAERAARRALMLDAFDKAEKIFKARGYGYGAKHG